MKFSAGIEKLILKFICHLKRPQIAKALFKKNKIGGFILIYKPITKL